MRRLLLLPFFAGFACAQAPIANPGFELADANGIPNGWSFPPVLAKAGFAVGVADQACHSGMRCAVLTGTPNAPPNMFGNLMQTLPASGYIGHRVRLRASIRVEGAQTRAQMWLRVDRADNSMAFLENMGSRPIISSEWKTYDIETNVPADAARFALGFLVFGPGKVWVDDVSIERIAEVHKDPAEAPRPLTPQGLTNLTAFTKLYGYVRFFHPSDQAAKTDWETFAVEGARKAESAASNAELTERLRQIFEPIAPSVRVFPTAQRPKLPEAITGPEVVRYKHTGVGLATTTIPNNIYKSQIVREKAGAQFPAPFEAVLVPGITSMVPVALYADSEGTLPHAKLVSSPFVFDRDPTERATRLAAVIIAWNVFQHFYPYFDVVKTDWNAELAKALTRASTDTGVDDFSGTLRLLVAALKDGHGNVYWQGQRARTVPPLTLDWVGDQFLVTRVQSGKGTGAAVGERVLKIDGKPVEQAAAEIEQYISGATPQWIRYRSATELSVCNPATKRMSLELEPVANPKTIRTVELPCAMPKIKDMETYTEPRPEKIAELEPGIIYVDLDRVTEEDWIPLVPRLEKATGSIFDMRGYPAQPGIQALAHLTDSTIRSAKWNVASAALPDRLDSPYTESGWDVQPAKPYFSARRVFLTDGRAISYAETIMGIVERFKLGEIVGGPTAGTNGNVNPFALPGGFTVSWTGMKVLKHDGTQHHGVGILPTVPVSRTRQGVAESKDEILLRGLEVVKGNR